MRKRLFALSAFLLLTACELSIGSPNKHPIAGDLGWFKVKGAVYADNIASGHELAGAVVNCSPANRPKTGSCSPFEVTTGDDGSFSFDVFVHDTTPFYLSVQKPGYKSMEQRVDMHPPGFLSLLLVSELPDTANMTLVNQLEEPRGNLLAVEDGYAYLANWYDLSVVDVSNPVMPVARGMIVLEESQDASDIAVVSGCAYLARHYGLSIIDISNPDALVQLESWIAPPTDSGNSPSDRVVIIDKYAFVSDSAKERLVILDLSDPSIPILAGIYAMPRRTVKEPVGYYSIRAGKIFAFTGNYLLVAGNDIRILDISNPANPLQIGVYDLTPTDISYPYTDDMAIAGGFAYVAAGFAGLQIVDLSDPTAPKGVGVFPEIGYAKRVVIGSNFAYVLDGYGRVWVMDISNPIAPVKAGLYNVLKGGDFKLSVADVGGLDDIALVGGYIFAVSAGEGIYILKFHPSL